MLKPEILVFAGPNGSGKSTITSNIKIIGEYINADEIKKSLGCSDLEAAQKATALRENLVQRKADFTFETVLSSTRNIELLQKAKNEGYFIKCFYVLTENPSINVQRVSVRVQQGGHDVPKSKIIERYTKCLNLIPQIIELSDVFHLYDNTIEPFRIFKKRKDEYLFWESEIWNIERIKQLVEIK